MTRQEKLLREKIPCAETGIEIKHTICDICTPGAHCGVNAYVKDGKLLKVEGTPGYPGSNGKLCTKGAANRQYIYREDRIKTPMLRVGPRGSDQFVPISWDEAMDRIEENLKKIKAESGPESVAWFSGYSKWYRPWLRRLCHSFGGHNYMTESSTCFRAGRMANELVFGRDVRMDLMNTPGLIVAWGTNPYINAYLMGRGVVRAKQAGSKIVIIDVRRTQATEKLADIHLRPKIGTDGVLAHAMAKVILDNGWEDKDFIAQYAHGFDAYREMVSRYDLDTAQKITGVPKEDIVKTAELIAKTKPCALSPSNGIVHHKNGVNTHRAIMALNVITGNFDKPGTLLPVYDSFLEMGAGFETGEEEFIHATVTAKTLPQVGEERFPLWNRMTGEGQTMDLVRQIRTGKPYPIRALAAFGMNNRMFPQTENLREALKELDFMFATDLFWTEACNYADVVLPVCSSFERGEVKCYPGGFIAYTEPVIDRVGDCRSDVEIIAELAKRLDTGDELLAAGYDAAVHAMFADFGDELDRAKASDMPIRSSHFKPYRPGTYLSQGPETPTGKLELYSEVVAAIDPGYGLNPLAEWYDGDNPCDTEEYPFVLMTGARLPNTIHSRGHNVPWLRSLRPEPMVDIHPEDAARLGIAQGDVVQLKTSVHEVTLKANLTLVANRGELHMIHGYAEANANDLLSDLEMDPYSGFPSYKQVRCQIKKEGVQ